MCFIYYCIIYVCKMQTFGSECTCRTVDLYVQVCTAQLVAHCMQLTWFIFMNLQIYSMYICILYLDMLFMHLFVELAVSLFEATYCCMIFR